MSDDPLATLDLLDLYQSQIQEHRNILRLLIKLVAEVCDNPTSQAITHMRLILDHVHKSLSL